MRIDNAFGTMTFAVLLGLSATLNLLLFAGLSAAVLTQVLMAAIGLSLDATKGLAVIGALDSQRSRKLVRIPVICLFMLVSVIASTTVINAGLSGATQNLQQQHRAYERLDSQIDLYEAQIQSLTEDLESLPYDWPRNREIVLEQISDTQETLDRLTERRSEVDPDEGATSSSDRTGRFLYELASILDVSPEASRVGFALVIALLIELGIGFTASYVPHTRSKTVQNTQNNAEESEALKQAESEGNPALANPYVRYVIGAFPQTADSPLKGLEAVSEEQGLSMYWARMAHSRLKEEGLIKVNGRRSISSVGRDRAVRIAARICA